MYSLIILFDQQQQQQLQTLRSHGDVISPETDCWGPLIRNGEPKTITISDKVSNDVIPL